MDKTRRYPGLYRGIVTRVLDDRTIARVKLRIPHVYGEANESPWARVQGLGGGVNLGAVLIPPVGAHVYVSFEHGNVNLPVVTGGVWNSVVVDGQNAGSELPAAMTGGDDPARNTSLGATDPRGSDTAIGANKVVMTEPSDPYEPVYPKNFVIRTNGALIELDSTDGKERINITHVASKTWIEIHPDGELVIGVKGRRYTVVDGNDDKHIKGQSNVVIDGISLVKSLAKFEEVGGDHSFKSSGKSTEKVGTKKTITSPNVILDAATKAEITGALANIISDLVNLGPEPRGNVVTTLTHPFDYITGLPIVGSNTVKAGS